ncbi:MAG: hypothetical protein ACOY3O_07325, partial [Thermodesulfobacteriota bacterium]
CKDVMATCCRYPGADASQQPAQILARARERWNLPELSDNIQAIDAALQALARNCNRQLVCEVLFLRLLAGAAQQQAT